MLFLLRNAACVHVSVCVCARMQATVFKCLVWIFRGWLMRRESVVPLAPRRKTCALSGIGKTSFERKWKVQWHKHSLSISAPRGEKSVKVQVNCYMQAVSEEDTLPVGRHVADSGRGWVAGAKFAFPKYLQKQHYHAYSLPFWPAMFEVTHLAILPSLRDQSPWIRPCITSALKHHFCQPQRQPVKENSFPVSYTKGMTVMARQSSCIGIYYENGAAFKRIVKHGLPALLHQFLDLPFPFISLFFSVADQAVSACRPTY